MENYKFIDSVLKKLNWDYIMKYYESHNIIEEEQFNKSGKKIRMNARTISSVKKELKNLIKFVIDNNSTELQHENWLIFWSKESEISLEIIFTPTRSAATYHDIIDDEIYNDEVEIGVLNDMLKKAVAEENYELCAVIYSRLKKLEKIKK